MSAEGQRARAQQQRAEAEEIQELRERTVTAVPTANLDGEPIGVWSAPSGEDEELLGTCLAFDLLASRDQYQVRDTIEEYSVMDPGRAASIAFAALETIGNYAVLALCHGIEHGACEDQARSLFADGARSARAARVGDLKSNEVAE